MHWDNVADPVNVDDELTMLNLWFVMLIDVMIFMVIVWYVENIKPGDFGVPLPWYFPFTVIFRIQLQNKMRSTCIYIL